MKRLIFILIISGIFYGCSYDPPLPQNGKFKITNYSKQDIFCYPSFEDNMDEIPLILNNETGKSNKFLFEIFDIPVKGSKSINGVSVWEDFINTNSKDSVIRIFIFSKALVKEYGWKNIVSTGKYTKKYVFNENQLESLNWSVFYKGY